jgi:DNA repair exonuclease SbcCD ATPase subunit
MNLKIEKLKIKNFMSFKEDVFDFGEYRGLTLVCGKNMDVPASRNAVGKSSLFSALLYVLFGELQYQIKNQNLRNRYSTEKLMSVELEFHADADRRFRLIRGLKGNSSFIDLKEIDEAGNIVHDLNRSSIMETDKFIQREIIHCDISIFLRTIILSSDQNYNFFKLTPAAKRDFIE